MISRNKLKILVLFSISLVLLKFMAKAKTLDEKIDSLVNEMTLQEKVDQLSNNGFMTTPSNKRLGIPGFVMDDGPHGVRFETATCFPLTMAMAAMWDRSMWRELGLAMGEEFQAFGKHVQLGPCIDLTRDPRNGRSGESGGEDPYLCGQLALNVVQGIQTTPTIATAKHYNCVNRQDNRSASNVIITERQLMGHYGYNFRKAVQEGGAMAVMSAYNLINGDHASESDLILNRILKDRWGFPFMVMSDWGSIHNSEKAIEAGNDLCMGNDKYKNDLSNLVNSGNVSEEIIDLSVNKVLKTKMLSGLMDSSYPQPDQSKANSPEHQQLCREADQKAIVLLKNQGDILPLPKDKKIALIGPSANKAQINIFGSSNVTPPYTVSTREGVENKIGAEYVNYTKGCDILSDDTSGFKEARTIARQSNYVVFVGGLDETVEGEGYGDGGDRKNNTIQLPEKQQLLINELAKVNQNLVVILQSGGVCAVSNCIDNIKGLLYAFYTSQEGGNALADVLFGDYNPGGKMPVTMPLSDHLMPPTHDSDFTDDFNCGYRYYDETGKDYQFAFGYGLSYTSFSYDELTITPHSPVIGDTITSKVTITNTGNREGEEVVQLYLSNQESSLWQPKKELKDFKRISLAPGESRTVKLSLDIEDFYYYDEIKQKYCVEQGKYVIKVGGSSDNLPLTKEITLNTGQEKSDLRVVDLLTYPRYPEKGDKVLLLATIKNYGTQTTSSDNIKVQWNVNGTNIALSNPVQENIRPGEMQLISCAPELENAGSWQPQEAGEYPVSIIVDPDNKEDEYYEDNNSKIDIVRVHSKPAKNLALNCSVAASSVEQNPPVNVDPENVNDGDMSTRWSSNWSDPQYIVIDFGDTLEFTRINIFWESAYAFKYNIQISNNGEDWNTIKHIASGDGGLDQFEGTFSSRYVRIYGTQRATQWGYSIYEIEIFDMDNEQQDIVLEDISKPVKFEFSRIYPNPFNNSTRIKYLINNSSFITLQVYNIIGEYIDTLVSKELAPGTYETVWQGKDDTGENMPSGIYLVCMTDKYRSVYQKIAYLK